MLLISGNALFRVRGESTTILANDLAFALKKRFQIEIPVVTKSVTEWPQIVAESPMAKSASGPSRLLLAVAHEARATLRRSDPSSGLRLSLQGLGSLGRL